MLFGTMPQLSNDVVIPYKQVNPLLTLSYVLQMHCSSLHRELRIADTLRAELILCLYRNTPRRACIPNEFDSIESFPKRIYWFVLTPSVTKISVTPPKHFCEGACCLRVGQALFRTILPSSLVWRHLISVTTD